MLCNKTIRIMAAGLGCLVFGLSVTACGFNKFINDHNKAAQNNPATSEVGSARPNNQDPAVLPNPNAQNEGYTMGGQFKTCPKAAPRDVCPAYAIQYTGYEQYWQAACEREGGKLLSCTSNECEWPVPSAGTQLCSKETMSR